MPDTILKATVAILAGGLGTRLRSVAPDRPKVLASVHDRPFITFLLDQISAFGVNRVLLLTGYRAAQVYATLGDRYRDVKLTYSEEPMPLGTGGALRHARERFGSAPVLLMNGDSYCGINLREFATLHRERGAHISMAAAEVSDCSRFGKLRFNEDGDIISFEEKRANAGAGWINAGVYLLQSHLVDEIPHEGPVSFEREMIPQWLADGKKVSAFCSDCLFLDIGTPESYAQAEHFFAEQLSVA